MKFSRKPFLDRVMVEVTPLDQIFDQGDVEVPLDNQFTNSRSTQGVVVAVGDGVPMAGVLVPMPVKVGDTVYFDSTAYAGRFYLKHSSRRFRQCLAGLEDNDDEAASTRP